LSGSRSSVETGGAAVLLPPALRELVDQETWTFWTMGAPIEETIIINRCKKENTYAVRFKEERLPE